MEFDRLDKKQAELMNAKNTLERSWNGIMEPVFQCHQSPFLLEPKPITSSTHMTVSNGKFVFCFQMEHVNEKTECVLNELNSKICLNLGYTTAKIHIISSQKSTTDQSQSGQ